MRLTNYDIYPNLYLCNTERKKLIHLLFLSSFCHGNSMLLNRDLLCLAFPIPDSVGYHDMWFLFIALIYSKFVISDTIITKYRWHDNNLTKTNNKISDDTEKKYTLSHTFQKCRNYFFRVVKYILNGSVPDNLQIPQRIPYIRACLQRLPDIDLKTKKLLLFALEINNTIKRTFLFRMRRFVFFIRYYNIIFSEKSMFFFIKRFIRYVLFK